AAAAPEGVERLLRGAAVGRPVADIVFFFQAEDGIRDKLVTGVQTCALPILPVPDSAALTDLAVVAVPALVGQGLLTVLRQTVTRSEERRVGKECRPRWSAEHA